MRAVYYIGAGGGNSTLCNVNDFVLGYAALWAAISVFDDIAGTKCSLGFVPVQSVIVDSQKRLSHIIVDAAFQLGAFTLPSPFTPAPAPSRAATEALNA